MKKDLGKISKVELREVWMKEPEFTEWLAEEPSLSALGEELGLEISLIKTEADVGDFSLDLLAEEAGTNAKIIIENQLETTDHDHLGKLITYASGHDAKYIIWIFKDVREEHRQAIDWLNKNTNDETNFFAVKLELWEIAGSKPAPKFDVICRPNEWAKAIKSSTSEPSERNLRQLQFFTELREYGQERYKDIRFQSPRPQAYMDVSIGSSNAHVAMVIRSQKQSMTCELYIPDNKKLYEALEQHKTEIESELGSDLDWQRLDNAKAARIAISTNFDINALGNRTAYFDWLLKHVTQFKKVFSRYIRDIEPSL